MNSFKEIALDRIEYAATCELNRDRIKLNPELEIVELEQWIKAQLRFFVAGLRSSGEKILVFDKPATWWDHLKIDHPEIRSTPQAVENFLCVLCALAFVACFVSTIITAASGSWLALWFALLTTLMAAYSIPSKARKLEPAQMVTTAVKLDANLVFPDVELPPKQRHTLHWTRAGQPDCVYDTPTEPRKRHE